MIKKYFRYFYGSVIFLVIFALITVGLSIAFTPNDAGSSELEVNPLLSEDKDSINVIVLGDSEAYSSISPMEIWEQNKITTYVCASSAQYLSHTYELLEQALKKQKPQVVILETNVIYREILFEKSLLTDLENTISILKYHDRWKSIGFSSDTDNNDTSVDINKGYVYRTNVAPAKNKDYMLETDKTEKIAKLNDEYVRSIAQKCKDNNSTLILLSTPSSKNWTMEKHNGINQLASELDLEYIDLNLMNDVIKINWKKDTKDKGDHLNYSGAKKVSLYLGNYLSNECSIERDYPDTVTEKWNKAYKHYSKIVK